MDSTQTASRRYSHVGAGSLRAKVNSSIIQPWTRWKRSQTVARRLSPGSFHSAKNIAPTPRPACRSPEGPWVLGASLRNQGLCDLSPDERLTGERFSESTITAFYLWLGEETGRHGKRRSATTRRKYVEVILNWWSWLASKDDWSEHVPARVPLLRHMDIAPALRRRTLAPTWEEMDACILSASGWQRQLYTVLRFTGLRVQQAMGLRWDDLDLDRRVLHVRPELGKTAQEKQGRWVPVSEHLVEIVAGWGLREDWLIETGRVPGANGRSDRVARSRDARRAWNRAIKKYEVRPDVAEQPHHCFRKGFVSGLKRLGADDEAVEVLVGHSLGLRGVYTDPDAQPLKAAIKLVPAIGEPRVRGAVVELRRGA